MVDRNFFVEDLKQFFEGEVILIDKDIEWTSFDVVKKKLLMLVCNVSP